jgi:hypothetical protein
MIGVITGVFCDVYMETRPETFNIKDRKMVFWALIIGWPVFYMFGVLVGASIGLDRLINWRK